MVRPRLALEKPGLTLPLPTILPSYTSASMASNVGRIVRWPVAWTDLGFFTYQGDDLGKPPANLPHVHWLQVGPCQPLSCPSGRGRKIDRYTLTQSLGRRTCVLYPDWLRPALTRGLASTEYWTVSHCHVCFTLTHAAHFILILPDIDSFIII